MISFFLFEKKKLVAPKTLVNISSQDHVLILLSKILHLGRAEHLPFESDQVGLPWIGHLLYQE